MQNSPNNRRKASLGFLCASILIVLTILLNSGLWFAYRHSHSFVDWSKHHGLTAEALLLIFRNGLWFFVVLCFIRPAGTRDFLKRTGLNTRPTFIGWLATWPAIIIGFVGLYASA